MLLSAVEILVHESLDLVRILLSIGKQTLVTERAQGPDNTVYHARREDIVLLKHAAHLLESIGRFTAAARQFSKILGPLGMDIQSRISAAQ